MKDPWNPQKEELLIWAYDTEALWPEQDFDLAVAELDFADLILELASDDNCPKQNFFLRCAYLIVGDAVRTNYNTHSKSDIEQFLSKIKRKQYSKLDVLYERSQALIANPSSFDYNLWCDGGLANDSKKANRSSLAG